jgi:DNA polymerase IV
MRAILHVDMDAFYASVEAHDRPELAGRPLIVGGTTHRGVVAAASYEVRRFGVHSAMAMREALTRCPHAVVVAPRMARYREVSDQVFAVFAEFTPVIEGLSLDEAYLDVTASQGLLGTPTAMARAIKARVRAQTGLPCSVGVSHNKLLAKIASDLEKPDGLCAIAPEDVHARLDPLPVRRLHGVGAKTAARLEARGLLTLGALRSAPEAELWPVFGRHAPLIRARAAGEDDRPVIAHWQEQQVSSEETFERDLDGVAELDAALAALADRASARLRARGLVAGHVTVKIRRADYSTLTRGQVVSPPTQDSAVCYAMARRLFWHWREQEPKAAIRLLGVSLGALGPASQLDLFAVAQPSLRTSDRAGIRLDPVLDDIRSRFGVDAVCRASNLDTPAIKQDGFTEVRRR